MDNAKIILDNGIEKEVPGIIYIYKAKYYLIYTEKQIDENGYVLLNLVQVGKEIKNTEAGPVETGYMIGLEVSNEEYSDVQNSITRIVEDKKNGTQSQEIQYLPMTILSPLKILSKKTFKLLRPIVEQYFKVIIEEQSDINASSSLVSNNNVENNFVKEEIPQSMSTNNQLETNIQEKDIRLVETFNNKETNLEELQNPADENVDVIIDYRASFFEEKQKNHQLEEKIQELTEKLQNIKKIIE